MWSDQARLASAAARGANGSGVPAQGAATQAGFIASAAGNPYAGRPQPGAGASGEVIGRNVPAVSGSASFAPAHSDGVAAISRSMNNPSTTRDTTRIDQLKASSEPIGSYQTQADRNTISNIATRNTDNATMVGDHTRAVELQKYLD